MDINETLKNEISQLLLAGNTVNQTVKKIYNKLSPKTIRRHFPEEVKLSVKIRRSNLYNQIIQYYEKEKRFTYIADHLKVSEKTISDALNYGNIKRVNIKDAGLVKRQYPLNDNFFNKIDSFEKAYYLGLIYADGTTIFNDQKYYYGMKICLTREDSYILEDLNNSLRFGKKMIEYIYKDERGKPCMSLSAISKKIANSLIKLGCPPRKSLILKFPKEDEFFDKKYMGCFLRGYFDGDGGCDFYSPRLNIRITSSHNFCLGFADYMKQKFNENCYVYNRGKYSTVSIIKNLNKIKFYNLIYKDTEFKTHLKRKKVGFDKYVDYLEKFSKTKGLSKNQLEIMKIGKIAL